MGNARLFTLYSVNSNLQDEIGGQQAVASLSLPGGQFSSFSCIFPHFPSIFLHFLPHFGLPGGRLAHPGRPWLRHWWSRLHQKWMLLQTWLEKFFRKLSTIKIYEVKYLWGIVKQIQHGLFWDVVKITGPSLLDAWNYFPPLRVGK